MTAVVGISPNRALLVNQRIHGVGIQRGNHYILLYHRSPQYVLRIDSLEVRKNRVPLKLLEIVSLLQLIALRLRIDFKERPKVLQIVKGRLKLAVSKLLETYHKGLVRRRDVLTLVADLEEIIGVHECKLHEVTLHPTILHLNMRLKLMSEK